jgi:hypothetical protein
MCGNEDLAVYNRLEATHRQYQAFLARVGVWLDRSQQCKMHLDVDRMHVLAVQVTGAWSTAQHGGETDPRAGHNQHEECSKQ